jgi:hypothetical protein
VIHVADIRVDADKVLPARPAGAKRHIEVFEYNPGLRYHITDTDHASVPVNRDLSADKNGPAPAIRQ